jgi:Tfp pilus assembly protein PilO
MLEKFGITIDDRKKTMILAAAIGIATFFICLNIIKAQARRTDTMRQKIKNESERLVLRRDIEKIEKKQAEYNKYFYSSIDQQALRIIILNLARDIGLNIVSVKPLERENLGDIIYKESLNVTLNSTYNQLGEFIAKIENLDHITKVESLTARAGSAARTALDSRAYESMQISQRGGVMDSDTIIDISMVVSAYSMQN